MKEIDLENEVCAYAERLGYRAIKLECRNHQGVMFPGHKGLTDRLFVGHGITIWIEFKTQTGKLSKEQIDWGKTLKALGQQYYVCRNVRYGKQILDSYVTGHKTVHTDPWPYGVH